MNAEKPDDIQFPWGHTRRFNDLPGYLKATFGFRVQKLSIDAGFTCPNRDGTVGIGGCSFCNNKTFNPFYCSSEYSVSQQINKGKAFFEGKYPEMHYLAYFQAFTNTYASLDQLQRVYEEALACPGIKGIVVGTRPDCIDNRLLDYFEQLSHKTYVSLEYGIESTLDSTLIRVNRGHDFKTSVEAVHRTAARGIPVSAHLILGLPGENIRDMLGHAQRLNLLPLSTLKIHQLQIIKGTPMEQEFREHPEDFITFTVEEYMDLIIQFLELLNPAIVVERFTNSSPAEMVSGKQWGLKNYVIVAKILKEMEKRQTWQGRLYHPNE